MSEFVPFYMKNQKTEINPSETWANEIELENRRKQKIGRLKREIKKHPVNCWKRQHALLKLQEVVYFENDKKLGVVITN